jgi:hypothetical protein
MTDGSSTYGNKNRETSISSVRRVWQYAHTCAPKKTSTHARPYCVFVYLLHSRMPAALHASHTSMSSSSSCYSGLQTKTGKTIGPAGRALRRNPPSWATGKPAQTRLHKPPRQDVQCHEMPPCILGTHARTQQAGAIDACIHIIRTYYTYIQVYIYIHRLTYIHCRFSE